MSGEVVELWKKKSPRHWIHVEGRGHTARVVYATAAGGWSVVKRGFKGVAQAREWGDEYARFRSIPFLPKKPRKHRGDNQKISPGCSVYRSHKWICTRCSNPLLEVKNGRYFLCWVCTECLVGDRRTPAELYDDKR